MPTAPPIRRSPSVLFVEDEPRLREVLSTAMSSWGFDVHPARSGEEALRAMDERPRDIALLDLNLPGIGGIELFEKLRERSPQVAVIVLTGFGDLPAARAAIRLDVVDFLTKPCRLDDLETALERAWRKSPVSQRPIVPETPLPAEPNSPARTLEEMERQHILSTLLRNHGNRTAAALDLGISRRTLQYRLSEYQAAGWVER